MYQNHPIILNSLLYADELLAETENDLQRQMYTLQNICQKYDMKISPSETETMAFSGKYPQNNKCCTQYSTETG